MGPKAENVVRTRPGKLALGVGFLRMLRSRSTCKRGSVAALITDPDIRMVYSMGYNGPAKGEANDTCRNEQGNCGCVHAEANALVKLRASERNLVMFSSASPCEMCARLIVNCGAISRVLYLEDYRTTMGLNILRAAGIEFGKLEPAKDSEGQAYQVALEYDWIVETK